MISSRRKQQQQQSSTKKTTSKSANRNNNYSRHHHRHHPQRHTSTSSSSTSSKCRLSTCALLSIIGTVLNVIILCVTITVYQKVNHDSTAATTTTTTKSSASSASSSSSSTSTLTFAKQQQQQQQQQQPEQPEQILQQHRPQQNQNSNTNNNDENNNSNNDDDDPFNRFHIIFSTGCSPIQHWQSYLLFYSIMKSGQTGDATRIASGCTQEERVTLREKFDTEIVPMTMGKVAPTETERSTTSAHSRFHLHFTPEFGIQNNDNNNNNGGGGGAGAGPTNIKYKYLNKPYGVAHWMEHVLGYNATVNKTSIPEHDKTIIVLLDPDMHIMKPFINDFSSETSTNEIWAHRTSYPLVYKIRHGHPMAAEYGYGNVWHTKIMNENKLASILPPPEYKTSPVHNMTISQVDENYATGPPYMATGYDFYKLATKWRQLSVPVLQQFPDTILAEMYAYSWAAAHLNLPHQLSNTFMVSASFESKAFAFMEERQQPPKYSNTDYCRNIRERDKPHVLHYCQRYALGKYIHGKWRIPINFLANGVGNSCQHPLLAEPPNNISESYDYYIDPDSHQVNKIAPNSRDPIRKQKQANRISFLLCEQLRVMNEAALYYKQQHCNKDGSNNHNNNNNNYNTNKTLIFHDTLEITSQELSNYIK